MARFLFFIRRLDSIKAKSSRPKFRLTDCRHEEETKYRIRHYMSGTLGLHSSLYKDRYNKPWYLLTRYPRHILTYNPCSQNPADSTVVYTGIMKVGNDQS